MPRRASGHPKGKPGPAPSPGAKQRRARGSGSGSSRTPATSTPRTEKVSLILHGGGSTTIAACGVSHHYRSYARGTTISVSGHVTPVPSGRWKVKLRIKRCNGSAFTGWAKLSTQRDRHTGTFAGTFAAPARGDYSVRAALYVNGSRVAESAKRHFATG